MVLLGTDGVNLMSVAERVARQARGNDGRCEMADGVEMLPKRNPFRRKTWNLTEQMQLTRRDPRLARKLKAKVWAEGEN